MSKYTLGLILFFVLSSCAGIPTPKPTECLIISSRRGGSCIPADPSDPRFDLAIREMIGYSCYSPKDMADIKTFIRRLLELSDQRQKDATTFNSPE